MKFTKEQIAKAASCKSVEELIALAKAEGIELSLEEAGKYFEALAGQALNLDDLGAVTGGGSCAGDVCGANC